jgi:hypothetical protein
MSAQIAGDIPDAQRAIGIEREAIKRCGRLRTVLVTVCPGKMLGENFFGRQAVVIVESVEKIALYLCILGRQFGGPPIRRNRFLGTPQIFLELPQQIVRGGSLGIDRKRFRHRVQRFRVHAAFAQGARVAILYFRVAGIEDTGATRHGHGVVEPAGVEKEIRQRHKRRDKNPDSSQAPSVSVLPPPPTGRFGIGKVRIRQIFRGIRFQPQRGFEKTKAPPQVCPA